MTTQKKNPTANAKAETHKTGNEKALIPMNELQQIHDEVYNIMEKFPDISQDVALSEAERRRLQGSGIRRYGFIDKVSDLAAANTDFVPPFMSIDDLKDLVRQIEILRNTSANLQQLLRMVNDELLVTGDEAYRIALMYYNSVRDASRRRVPGAAALFNMLRPFFTSMGRRKTDEPTEKEIEKDVKALLHGKKEDEIIVKNEKPTTSGGMHEVIDEVHRGRATIKETIEENEKN
ncbi:MAG: hypothetical protein LBI45_05860 [Bacteroidales bacterium]|jgi:hypothetical protein|nr:hypothetical protein [Bacteroidales bacterium]